MVKYSFSNCQLGITNFKMFLYYKVENYFFSIKKKVLNMIIIKAI